MDSNHPPLINYKPPHSAVAPPLPLPEFPYFSDHLRTVCHMEPAYGGHPQLSGPNYQLVNDYHRHPIGMHGALWRQIEKQRIKEEIIAEQIARRRILEAEVMRELLIERDMLQRRIDCSIHTSYLKPMIVDPKDFPHLKSTQKMEEISNGESTGMSALVRRGFESFETVSQSRAEPRTFEFMTPPDTVNEKEKIILLAKPEGNNSGVKRKAEVLPSVSAKRKAVVSASVGVSELPAAGAALKKVGKEEFSCALCQVITTSERALKEHLQGKKHKAKVAGLMKNEKNFSIGLYPKTICMPNELPKIPSSPCLEKGVNFSESVKPRIAIPAEANSENSETNNDPVAFRSRQLHQTLKQNESPVCRTGSGRKARERKNFKFWCEMCQVGVFSETVMEAHRKGRKHLALLLKQNTVIKPSTQIMQAKQEMNPTEEAGVVVEGISSRDLAPIVGEVKLVWCQKEAGKDGECIASQGLGLVVDEVELEGNQNEAVKDATSES